MDFREIPGEAVQMPRSSPPTNKPIYPKLSKGLLDDDKDLGRFEAHAAFAFTYLTLEPSHTKLH
jgi:hypothetical protein